MLPAGANRVVDGASPGGTVVAAGSMVVSAHAASAVAARTTTTADGDRAERPDRHAVTRMRALA